MCVFCALVFHFGKHVDGQTDMGREEAGCFETEESQLLLLLSISQSLSLTHTQTRICKCKYRQIHTCIRGKVNITSFSERICQLNI